MSQEVEGSAASRFLDEMKHAHLVSRRAWIALCVAAGLACFVFLLSGMPKEGNELAERMVAAGGALQASHGKHRDVNLYNLLQILAYALELSLMVTMKVQC